MTRPPYPSELQDRTLLRFPEGLKDRVAEAAKRNRRSMNAEIVARLEISFDAEEPGQLWNALAKCEPPMATNPEIALAKLRELSDYLIEMLASAPKA